MPAVGTSDIDPAWYTGPTSDLAFTPQHDRTILDIKVNAEGDKVVTASADHGLRLYDT